MPEKDDRAVFHVHHSLDTTQNSTTHKEINHEKTLFFLGLATAMGFNNAQAVDWNWNGDIRFRYDSSKTELASSPDKPADDRYRLRARFGVSPTINDELSAGLRLATGDGKNPTSTNQTPAKISPTRLSGSTRHTSTTIRRLSRAK